jgi:molecular chaperone GrpE
MSERVEPRAEGIAESEEGTSGEDTPEAGPLFPEDSIDGEDDSGSSSKDDTEEATPEEVEEAEAEQEPERDFTRLQRELDQLNDQHLRLAAEFSNYRRRAESETSRSWGRGQADLLRHLLDALDDLQRVGAWEPETTTVEALVEGIDLVERKIRQALEAAGVQVLNPVGESFDPNHMEAMFTVPAESDDQEEQVAEVLQKGYILNGHLVRPARVGVYKHE